MAITFVANGALAIDAATATLAVDAPTCLANDILVCALLNKELTVTISPPDGTWTQLAQNEIDSTVNDFRFALFWKKATASGGTFNFTKSADNNILFIGVISAWRGSPTPDSPIDVTAVGVSLNTTAADNVTFPAFDPTATAVHVIYTAFYGDDATTFAAAMSADTNPDCTTRFDLESNAGTDGSIACTSGDNDGSSIASRTWASASTTDAGSAGVVFALIVNAPALTPLPTVIGYMGARTYV